MVQPKTLWLSRGVQEGEGRGGRGQQAEPCDHTLEEKGDHRGALKTTF